MTLDLDSSKAHGTSANSPQNIHVQMLRWHFFFFLRAKELKKKSASLSEFK